MTNVTITFRTPARESDRAEASLHKRTVVGVPLDLAQQMAEDFVQYQSTPDEDGRSKLYRFEKEGNDVLVALNFDEIIAVTASES